MDKLFNLSKLSHLQNGDNNFLRDLLQKLNKVMPVVH